MNTDILYDKITGQCIREISFADAPQNSLYLTFDDGPDADCTPKVLELLARYQVKATFFVIGEKAKAQTNLIQDILSQGHSLGDHTIDHDTSNYFKDEIGIAQWLGRTSELQLKTVGFRSPLGIKTPALNKVLLKKKLPLVLWNQRFYDTKYGLTTQAVDKKLSGFKTGSIILLHDTHQAQVQTEFLKALEHMIVECQKKNFIFLPLTEKLIQKSYLEKYETKK